MLVPLAKLRWTGENPLIHLSTDGWFDQMLLRDTRAYFAEARRNSKLSHVVLPLCGRFKGETGETFDFVTVTAKSDSGLKIGSWVERGIDSRDKREITQDYFFTSIKGRIMRSRDLEIDILDRIARIQQEYPDLIRPGLEIHEKYRLSRSFRLGSNSEDQNLRVDDWDIDRNNRWRKVERAGARKVKLRTRGHYTDVLVSLESFSRYSHAL